MSRETLRTALHRLESEGTLAPGGISSPREIKVSVEKRKTGKLRVVVFSSRKLSLIDMNGRMLLLNILHDLEAAGHSASWIQQPYATEDPGPAALARLVREKSADAWVVFMGSMSTLQWFSQQSFPAIALGGRSREVNIAATGSDFCVAIADSTRHLIQLGHRRIVYITPKQARLPTVSLLLQSFQKELKDSGIPVGSYNSPDWEESPTGFHKLLESLFQVTPPTALILWNSLQVSAALAFFAARNIRVPEDVSIISHDSDENVTWQNPLMGAPELSWEPQRITRQVVRWVESVATGENNREQHLFPARFSPTNSVRPPPGRITKE